MLEQIQIEILAEVLNRAPATKSELYVIREVFAELQRQVDEQQAAQMPATKEAGDE